ncbi:RlpA-like double-psi beta-barrel domain-containing protein [Peterkaempfera bronchialis]|uniref:Secreted protein n=1 Tax=Peterkaempfera bronchialis TaxID=2126346 RepID=A0A345T6Z8_9ACTN|nr:hypothetical protein [Peterkaempfera bronchialis]AXI81753.1 hypothetical protein C7M71_028970 [Peterkaempfera bronchialis]
MAGTRKIQVGRTGRIALLVGAAGLVAGGVAMATGSSQAAENCDGLDTVLRNNLDFIAGQRADPDALSEARIANRQAVVDQIQQRRQVAGCTAVVTARSPMGGQPAPGMQGSQAAQDGQAAQGGQAAQPAAGTGAGTGVGVGQAAGEVVCPGSTVTLSGEGGAPAASSNQFPAGTRLKVTNLDNGASTTVEVTSVSGSCVLLNNAAFEQVREPGKFLIRNARIERVG